MSNVHPIDVTGMTVDGSQSPESHPPTSGDSPPPARPPTTNSTLGRIDRSVRVRRDDGPDRFHILPDVYFTHDGTGWLLHGVLVTPSDTAPRLTVPVAAPDMIAALDERAARRHTRTGGPW